jgi:hypothetical protein
LYLGFSKRQRNKPIHVVWGIPKGCKSPAVLVTAYRPDPEVWEEGFFEEKVMKKRIRSKLVHEGKYIAEIDVELIKTNDEWSPYLSLDDAYKLDIVREALKIGDVKTASKHGRVYTLTPIVV